MAFRTAAKAALSSDLEPEDAHNLGMLNRPIAMKSETHFCRCAILGVPD